MKFFNKNKTRNNEELDKFGCVSRRDKDTVIVARHSNGMLNLSKFSRKASLETLRLNGVIRTAATNYEARTSRLPDLAFPGITDEIKIGTAFVNYLQNQKKSLSEKCAAFTVDNTGTVAGITALEKDVAEAAVAVEGFRARPDVSCPVEVETRGRAALRYFLHSNISRSTDTDALSLSVCAVVVEDKGYSIAFWNSEKLVCWEVELPFVGGGENEDNWTAVRDYITNILTPASLGNIGVSAVNHLVVAASAECRTFLRKELGEDKIDFETIDLVEGTDYVLADGSYGLDESQTELIIVAGLLIDDDRVPHINLNRDLVEFLRIKEQDRVLQVQRKTATANRNLGILVVSPAVLAFVCLVIWYVTLNVQERYVQDRLAKAEAEDARLTNVKKELQDVKDSSDKVQVVSDTIGTLKKRQPANFLLLMNLNRKWPAGADWQIDEITSKQDGTVTIKGKTRSDESLTEFARSLDFSEDFEAVKVSKGEGGTAAGMIAGGSTPSDVIKFAVETRYLPLVQPVGNKSVPSAPPAGQVNQPPTGTVPPQVAGAVNQPATPKKPNS